tara:strand:+ start:673 stop:1017 length:345 start_codon:yes stop_codon:yes gene_type:complete
MKINRTQMNEDWEPSKRILDDCKEKFGKELDIEYEIEQFKDYYIATGKTYSNWDVKFRAWCRQNVKWQQQRTNRTDTDIVSKQRNRIFAVVDKRNGGSIDEKTDNKIKLHKENN